MTSGGARARSGPLPQEGSARSRRRGYTLGELDAAGYAGPVPDFPLPEPTRRELEVWAQSWRLPQGCLWSSPGHQWLLMTIGLYVRQLVKCESADVGAAQLAQLHRFADQVGMTTAGLAAHGFKVIEQRTEPAPVKPQGSLERQRLRLLAERSAS